VWIVSGVNVFRVEATTAALGVALTSALSVATAKLMLVKSAMMEIDLNTMHVVTTVRYSNVLLRVKTFLELAAFQEEIVLSVSASGAPELGMAQVPLAKV
jgi:hypothetical protein